MTKYTLVSSTNRQGANSLRLCEIYQQLLKEKGIDAEILDLQTLPRDFVFSALYDNMSKNEHFNGLLQQVNDSEKFIFTVPEYNGSFPGVLKAFIDGLDYPGSLKNKKAALVGLSSGTQGSALALSHLTDIFNYLGMHVYAQKPRLMHIEQNLPENGVLSAPYMALIQEQVDGFITF